MITCKEFTNKRGLLAKRTDKNGEYRSVYLHAIDVVRHVLKADETETLYKAPNQRNKMSNNDFIEELRAGMEQRVDKADFIRIRDEKYADIGKKWTIHKGETGDIDVDRYIDRDELPFDEPFRTKREKPAMFIVFDTTVPYRDRYSNYMADRHREIYNLVLQCEAEQVPCKVVSVSHIGYPEGNLRIHLTIKDWNDPIFPGIWGAYASNLTTNAFANMVSMFLVGTKRSTNGECMRFNIREDYPYEDITLINPIFIQDSGGKS